MGTSIRLNCPSCGKSYSMASEHAGKTGKCKQCGEILHIPADAVVSPSESAVSDRLLQPPDPAKSRQATAAALAEPESIRRSMPRQWLTTLYWTVTIGLLAAIFLSQRMDRWSDRADQSRMREIHREMQALRSKYELDKSSWAKERALIDFGLKQEDVERMNKKQLELHAVTVVRLEGEYYESESAKANLVFQYILQDEYRDLLWAHPHWSWALEGFPQISKR